MTSAPSELWFTHPSNFAGNLARFQLERLLLGHSKRILTVMVVLEEGNLRVRGRCRRVWAPARNYSQRVRIGRRSKPIWVVDATLAKVGTQFTRMALPALRNFLIDVGEVKHHSNLRRRTSIIFILAFLCENRSSLNCNARTLIIS